MIDWAGLVRLILIALLLIIAGTLSTLTMKLADNFVVDGIPFQHPFFQADVTFVGEMFCLVIHFAWQGIRHLLLKMLPPEETVRTPLDAPHAIPPSSQKSTRKPNLNCFLFAIPALFSVVATSLQHIGLYLTSASSYQMLRDSFIIFTGLLSTCVLGVSLHPHGWVGILILIAGMVVVGVADFTSYDETSRSTAITVFAGDSVIIIGEVFAAAHFFADRQIKAKCNTPPLLATGVAGIYKFLMMTLIMVPMCYINVGNFSRLKKHRMEDPFQAFETALKRKLILWALCIAVVCIALFNVAMVCAAKYMSAAMQVVVHTMRTIVVWMVPLLVPLYFTEHFIPLQVLGFVLIVFGTVLYKDVIIMPFIRNTARRFHPKPNEAAPGNEPKKQ